MFERVTLVSATLGEDGKTEPPLGPLYIAAAIEAAGVAVDFRDFQLQPGAHGFSGDPLADFCEGHGACVAFSCFVDMLPAVIDASRIIEERSPGTTVILGGPGPTASALRILEEFPWITGVVMGEGEETVVDWLRALDRGTSDPIPGMVLRQDGNLLVGESRPRNLSIDDLPPPAYHLIDFAKYTHARVITTRGCSYHCSFCDVAALWGHRSVFRGLEETIGEMELLRDAYGKSSIAIVDDTFVLNRKRVRTFCELLLARDSGLEWGCFGRINLMTPELVDLMARAGCRAIFYGIDSGSPAVLKRVHKVVEADAILPVLDYSSESFEKIEASFIWGYPFETYQDFEQTVAVASKASMYAPTVNVQMHMLSPLPMSPIYRSFEGELLPPEEADRDWLLLPALLFDERAECTRALVAEHPDIFPGFYTFPTPDKKRKRQVLRKAMRALDQTIGRTLFDPVPARLLDGPDREAELELLESADPIDRIGVGLALGLFRRTRRRQAYESGAPLGGMRGARLVRERNEPVAPV